MRDDLSEIFYDATRDNVEYVFADSITSISDDGEVAFEHGPSARSLDSCARGAVYQRAAGIGQPCDRETQFRQYSSA
jgi:hypothetical protein